MLFFFFLSSIYVITLEHNFNLFLFLTTNKRNDSKLCKLSGRISRFLNKYLLGTLYFCNL